MRRHHNDPSDRAGSDRRQDEARVPGRSTLVDAHYGAPGMVVAPDEQAPAEPAAAPERLARDATRGGGRRLPHFEAIQRAFGRHDVSDVTSYGGADVADAGRALGAHAFAIGNAVAFTGAPDLHTAAHETAHVVQQRGGARGVMGLGKADPSHEQHADAVADRVVHGESVESMLDTVAPDRGARPAGTSVHLLRVGRDDVAPGAKADVGPQSQDTLFRERHLDGYDTDELPRAELLVLRDLLRGTYRLTDPARNAALIAAVDAKLAAPVPPPTPAAASSGGDAKRSGAPSSRDEKQSSSAGSAGSGASGGSGAQPVHLSRVLARTDAPPPAPDTKTTAVARGDLDRVEAKLEPPASSVASGGGMLASAVSAVYMLGGYAAWLGVGRLFLEPIIQSALRRIFGVDIPRLELSFGMGFARIAQLELGAIARGPLRIGGVELRNVGIRFDVEQLDRAFWAADPSLLGQGMIVVEADAIRARDVQIVRNGAPLVIQLAVRGARFMGSHANLLDSIAQVIQAETFEPPAGLQSFQALQQQDLMERAVHALLRDNLQAAFKIDDLDVRIAGDLQRALGVGAAAGGAGAELKRQPELSAHLTGLHGAAVGRGSQQNRMEAQAGFRTAEVTASAMPVYAGGGISRASGRLAAGPTTVVHSGPVRRGRDERRQPGDGATTALDVGELNADRVAVGGAGPSGGLERLQIGGLHAEQVDGKADGSVGIGVGAIDVRGAHAHVASGDRDVAGLDGKVDQLHVDPITAGLRTVGPHGAQEANIGGGALHARGVRARQTFDAFAAPDPDDERDRKGERDQPMFHYERSAELDELSFGGVRAGGRMAGDGKQVDGDVNIGALAARGVRAVQSSEELGERSHTAASVDSLRLGGLAAAGTLRDTQRGYRPHAVDAELAPIAARGVAASDGARGARLAELDLATSTVQHDPQRSRATLGAVGARGLDVKQRGGQGDDQVRVGELGVGAITATSDAVRQARASRVDGGALRVQDVAATRGGDQLRVDRAELGPLHARVAGTGQLGEASAAVGIDGARVQGVRADGARRMVYGESSPPAPQLRLGELSLGPTHATAGGDGDPRLDIGAVGVSDLHAQTERARVDLPDAKLRASSLALGDRGLTARQEGAAVRGLEAHTRDPNIDAERLLQTELAVDRLVSRGTDVESGEAGSRIAQRGLDVDRLHKAKRVTTRAATETAQLDVGRLSMLGPTIDTSPDGHDVGGVAVGPIAADDIKRQANGKVKPTITRLELVVPPRGPGSARVQGVAHAVPLLGDQKFDLTIPVQDGRLAARDASTANVHTGHSLLVGAVGMLTNVRVENIERKDGGGTEPAFLASVAGARVETVQASAVVRDAIDVPPVRPPVAPVMTVGSASGGGAMSILNLIMYVVQSLLDRDRAPDAKAGSSAGGGAAAAAAAPAAPSLPSNLDEYMAVKVAAKARKLVALLSSGLTVHQTGVTVGGLTMKDRLASRDRDEKSGTPAAFSEALDVIVKNIELQPTEILSRLGVDPESPSPHAMTVLAILDDIARSLDVALGGAR